MPSFVVIENDYLFVSDVDMSMPLLWVQQIMHFGRAPFDA